MNTLKTIGIALFVAAVTAASVVWYIDYKINQVTEAVMAPVHSTTEKVSDTVSTVTEAVGDIVDDASSEMTEQSAQAQADLAYEWKNAKDLASNAGDWLDSLRS